MKDPTWSLLDGEAIDRTLAGADQAHFAELRRRALQAVRALPRPARRVFCLRWRRVGYREIAARLGISPATARKYYSEARRVVTAAILCGGSLLLALAGPLPIQSPLGRRAIRPTTVVPRRVAPSAVACTPVRPAPVSVSPIRIPPQRHGPALLVADLSSDEAETLLDGLLNGADAPTPK
ncbi:MAG: sigma-70 family RNA polymerase sigma factor [Planctomycetota bacterium]